MVALLKYEEKEDDLFSPPLYYRFKIPISKLVFDDESDFYDNSKFFANIVGTDYFIRADPKIEKLYLDLPRDSAITGELLRKGYTVELVY